MRECWCRSTNLYHFSTFKRSNSYILLLWIPPFPLPFNIFKVHVFCYIVGSDFALRCVHLTCEVRATFPEVCAPIWPSLWLAGVRGRLPCYPFLPLSRGTVTISPVVGVQGRMKYFSTPMPVWNWGGSRRKLVKISWPVMALSPCRLSWV